jgi:trans-L-3-hydroxyproline dehydratase
MSNMHRYRTFDMHTAGEPVRIIVEGYPKLHGRTILEKRRDARTRFDHIRRLLMLEPRGHSGMYGVIPTEPCDPTADLAVLFTHNEGYSTMCGHATIAVARWAVESGRVEPGPFRLEVPCGVIDVNAEATRTSFQSVQSFASHFDCNVNVPGFGNIQFDIAYGGAFYAILPSSQIGLPFDTTPLATLIDAGTKITTATREQIAIHHPTEPDLSFLYGTILTDDAPPPDTSYNLCIFAEGQIDRSPTGSGVTARMALDYARGRIAANTAREFRGVSGAAFYSTITQAEGKGLDARVRVRVAGESHIMGHCEFIVEASDPLPAGLELPPNFAALR